MRITFLGGADEVGASSLLIEIAGRRLLVDAGLRPSPKARWGLAGDQLPDLSQIDCAGGLDAILVTHAHTDHTGALELVVSRFPDIPVYATPATIALTRVLHHDSRRIMQTRYEEEGELPLFDDVAVNKLMAAFVPLPFHTRLPLADGLAATFLPAGHIAGAAMLGLESDEGRVLITGDLALSPQRTVDAAKTPPFHPDVLIMESTYGGRLHANRASEERRLVETVNQVVAAGGKVLIPAFALGRAQELLLILAEFRRRALLPPTPVWADGMVRAICQAYSSFPDVLPLALRERGAVFYDEIIRPIERNEQRNALIWSSDPSIIIASSGMLSGGPSMTYARALATQPQHAILLTGYQDEESPGRRLQEIATRGQGTLRLGKDKVDVQCRLGTYSLSAHADEGQLLSLVEALDPTDILLVHGDEPARASLSAALGERQRSVRLPHAGQSLEFNYAPRVGLIKARGIGAGQPLDLHALWMQVAGPGGGYFSLLELARAWWGDVDAADEAHLKILRAALHANDLYFTPRLQTTDYADYIDSGKTLPAAELYRARTPLQVDQALQHQRQMEGYAQAAGSWLILRLPGGVPALARCLSVASDHLQVTLDSPDGDAETRSVWPEEVLEFLGDSPPPPQVLDRYRSPLKGGAPHFMEPNQALAYANLLFPPEARLRRSGYRLEQRILALTFDFPEVARVQYAAALQQLTEATGWQVEVQTETNQAALNSLAREVLPAGWQIVKGPAIHREQKRVVISVSPAAQAINQGDLSIAAERFLATSGFELSITQPASPAHSSTPPPRRDTSAGRTPLEINAAYNAIKAALEGSTLYRTSLKGDTIVLSFISPQVGERHRPQIQALSQQTGWQLAINPQANQGAIMEIARALLSQAGWSIQKGPGIFLERGEVVVTLTVSPDSDQIAQAQSVFETQTGFRLLINTPAQAKTGQPATPPVSLIAHLAAPVSDDRRTPPPAPPPVIHLPQAEVIEIPIGRIRLRPFHANLALSPVKIEKTVERARRLGTIAPPIQVRRLPDGYLLLDGLYRLRAAQQIGLETIPATIE